MVNLIKINKINGKPNCLTLVFLLYLFISWLSLTICRKDPEENLLDLPEDAYELVDLDSENFHGYLKSPHFFVFIHNSWCSWSQKLEKLLTKVNLHLKLEKQPYYIGKIDSTVQDLNFIPELSTNKQYPALIYYTNGKFKELYLGRHSFNELFIWVKKRVYDFKPYNIATEDLFRYKLTPAKRALLYFPTKTELQHLEEKEESLEDDDHQSHSLNENTIEATNNFQVYSEASFKIPECKEVVFFYTTNKHIIEKYNQYGNYSFSIFKHGNQTSSYVFQQESVDQDNNNLSPHELKENNKNAFSAEIKAFCSRLTKKNFFSTFNEKAVESIFIRKTPAIILFRNVFNNKTEYEELKLQSLSYMIKDTIIIITDIDNKYSYKLANYFGIDNEMLPALRIIDFKGKNNSPRKLALTKDPSVENIFNFIQLWESNSLYHSKDSWRKKTINDKQNSVALTITPNEMAEKVFLNKKNVVVMYIADWCSHCKKHLPVFDIISQKLNQIIYSFVFVDVGDYYDEDLKIRKIPSLFVYLSFDKENPVEYKDEITASKLIKFLKKTVEKKEDL